MLMEGGGGELACSISGNNWFLNKNHQLSSENVSFFLFSCMSFSKHKRPVTVSIYLHAAEAWPFKFSWGHYIIGLLIFRFFFVVTNHFYVKVGTNQQAFTCLKSLMETLEYCVKSVSRHFGFFIVNFEQT